MGLKIGNNSNFRVFATLGRVTTIGWVATVGTSEQLVFFSNLLRP